MALWYSTFGYRLQCLLHYNMIEALPKCEGRHLLVSKSSIDIEARITLLLICILIHLQITSPQSHLQVLIRRNRLPLGIRIPTPLTNVITRLVVPNPLTGDHLERRGPNGMAKEGDAVPWLVSSLALDAVPFTPRRGENNAVHGAP